MLVNYNKIRILGKGAYGEVFLAVEKISGKEVAIKCLLEKDPENQESILHEIETVSKLSHPNVINYLHSFYDDGLLYLVMEYCSGGSLRDLLNKKNISYNIALKYCSTIAAAMDFIHNKEIIHHDIKPDNILFDSNNNLKISDFGISNSLGGTPYYKAPEMLNYNPSNRNDRRIDIYALGVTLFELISGTNPFWHLTENEINLKHEEMDFDFTGFPEWVQNIILKAIHKTPELRFQFMKDFSDAIAAKNVPILLSKDMIDAGNLTIKANRALKRKRWKNILKELEYADTTIYPNNVNIKIQLGRFYLFMRKLKEAKDYFESAKKLNPRISIQKELGNIYLELGQYPFAISLLSDHINLNPADLEAHNLLVKCYYETDRYEVAIDHLTMLLKFSDNKPCFFNNYYICKALMNSETEYLKPSRDQLKNPFLKYNHSVYTESEKSWNTDGMPTLKSKLIFQDFRFDQIKDSENVIEIKYNNLTTTFTKEIISFGRSDFDNDFCISESNNISRRQFVIINCKNDVWLYNLSNLELFVDNELINDKAFLTGLHEIRISDYCFFIKTDINLLL
ncbi:MAG: protein kinase [Candidatus Tenebribacter mawsonii]|nr:protein kinase [Candidatus Tenebribacter mawsonii]